MLDHKGLAKDHLGEVLSQPCCWHKLIFNWRHFTSSKKK